MKLLGNILKGTGFVLAALLGVTVWVITGPHSPEEVLKEMSKFSQEAKQMEINGDGWVSRGIANVIFNPQQCRSNYQVAFSVYLDAQHKYQQVSAHADKLGRWQETKHLQGDLKARAQRKVQELEDKIRSASNPPCL